MTKRFLLTSFDIWLPNHISNSSDDLLVEVGKLRSIPFNLIYLRKIPVDVETASNQVIAKIDETQPDYIICCGMAESRSKLSVESNARSRVDVGGDCVESVLYTTIDLEKLLCGSVALEISHDCGRFVCEGLYYSVLHFLHRHEKNIPCIFVHVPILTENNLEVILEDFLLIIHRLALS